MVNLNTFKNNKANLSSPLVKAMIVATSGMKAQADRLLVISQNLANAGTKAPDPNTKPYQRKRVSFITELDKENGVNLVKSIETQPDPTPFPKIYSPGDPGANADGFVEESNVKPMIELADMREAARTHEAITMVYKHNNTMLQDTIALLKS